MSRACAFVVLAGVVATSAVHAQGRPDVSQLEARPLAAAVRDAVVYEVAPAR